MRDDPTLKATEHAAKAGAATGGVVGLLTGLTAGPGPGGRLLTKSDLLRRALLGALGAGSLAGGSTYLGSKMLGAPDEDEFHGYSRRGALGGAVGGGLAGAGLGAAAARGTIFPESRNLLTQAFRGATRGKYGALKGAILGGLGLGVTGALQAGDEGVGLDFLEEELRRHQREEASRG